MYNKHIGIVIVVLTDLVFSQSVKFNCDALDGKKGLCKRSPQCQVESYMNRTRGIKPVICGRLTDNDDELVVCCTDIHMYLKTESSDFYYPGVEINEKKCQEYSEEIRRMKNFESEISLSDSIGCENGECSIYSKIFVVGGEDAEIDEFPHMALLGWDQVNGNGYDYKCGGSLISEEYILTAAHCIYIDDSELKTSQPTMIRLGGSNPLEIKISSIITHPDYRPPKKYNDIALIKLEQPIELTLKIYPACLYGSFTLRGSATAIGWGNTSPDGDKATQLQKVTLDLYDDQECKSGYPKSRSQPDGIADSQFCAGYKPGGKDACQGDSGGPIQRRNKQCQDIFDVIGITSFGAGCGSGRGGVYTRVSQYIEWIEKNVWPGERVF